MKRAVVKRPSTRWICLFAVALSMATAGCQPFAGDAVMPPAGVATDRGTLTLHLRRAFKVQALVEEVRRVHVEVRAADGAVFEREIHHAGTPFDQTSTTFAGLAVGGARVTLRAYDAGDRLIGQAARETQVQAGPTVLTMTLTLDQGLAASPSDIAPLGPVAALPTSAVFQTPALSSSVDGIGDIEPDREGNMWVSAVGEVIKVGPDGTRLVTVSGVDGSIAVDSRNHLWIGRLRQYDSGGNLLNQYAIEGGWPKSLEADAQDNMWLQTEDAVLKIRPDGQVDGVFGVGGRPTYMALAPGTGHMWALVEYTALRQLDPNGVVLTGTSLPVQLRLVPDHAPWWDGLTVDDAGQAWVIGRDDAKVIKVGSNGAILGQFATCVQPSALTVDHEGCVWVGSYGRGPRNLVRHAPDGTVLGVHTVASRIVQLVTDVAGHVWVRHEAAGFLTRVTP